MSIQCPRCNQGTVGSYLLTATGETLFVCDECEATGHTDRLDTESFLQLTVFLRERGLTPLWSELRPSGRESGWP